MGYRIEHDSMGEVAVPEEALWGAQTQRSLEHFRIGKEKIPHAVIRALAEIKRAAAAANAALGVLAPEKSALIAQVCGEIDSGALTDQFPLSVWQTGSGTQSNMNVNEVIAIRGNALAGKTILHPNDDVNRSQSSNDTFPSAMRIAAVRTMTEALLPALEKLIAAFAGLEAAYPDCIKVGRTHLQDAVPLRFAQEVSGWRAMLERDRDYLRRTMEPLYALALGGTAVGTGLNAPEGFDEMAAAGIAERTGLPFRTAENKFQALTSLDDLVFAHGALKALAADLMKIANDVRWLSSGPRCGLGELTIPANEPGSSIMPGKVNPTQCEAVAMTAVQVMGNDVAVGLAASQGNFELNVFLPVCIYNFLQSVRLLADVMDSFRVHCVSGIRVNEEQMSRYLERSLMSVTALNPLLGYDKAAEVAKLAYREGLTPLQAVVKLGYLDEAAAREALDPENMLKKK
ncbi:MAG: class II fumarate hydratase [Oscillospiraceae bacterium]|nr:class II fumarate hydratase [Oscillospiraceae bacterium]